MQLKDLVAGADSMVLFGVDDALFCADLPLGDAVAALHAHAALVCGRNLYVIFNKHSVYVTCSMKFSDLAFL